MAPPPPSGRQLVLHAHRQTLVVVEVGGGIRAYQAGGRDVFDPYAEESPADGGRGQILAPWPNRLADGAYEWEGRRLQAPLTEPEHHNAIHGLVRWSAWKVRHATTEAAQLTHRLHPQPGWPWTMDLSVTYRLAPTGLEVTTAAVNRSSTACPYGLGWHPYVAAFGGLVDDIVLTVPAASAYRSDERGLPVGTFAVSGSHVDFRSGRPVGAARIDVAFTDLERDAEGRATVVVAGGAGSATEVRLWVDRSFSHLMVFTGDTLSDPDRRRRGLAVEPMTGAPDMLRSGDGRRVLEPEGRMEATWGVAPFGEP